MIRSASIFVTAIALASPTAGQTVAETGFDRFWDAGDRQTRIEIGREIARSGIPFAVAHRALRVGRAYRADVPTGTIEGTHRNSDGTLHPYFFIVPDDYDPTRRYGVRFYLHGGVGRATWSGGRGWWRRTAHLERDDAILVFPASWRDSMWWQASQIEALDAILESVKRSYNIDENRVYMFGVSDGGTGAYFHALKSPTRWAAFLPFIGHAAVLGNPRVGVDGEMFITNAVNVSLFVANGEIDRLYPARSVEPWIDRFRGLGADVTFRARPEGHTVEWWPEEASSIEAFVSSRSRDPLPGVVDWATDDTRRYGRAFWVSIDRLGRTPRDADLALPADDPYLHSRPWGRVRVERVGNRVDVTTRGVKAFSLWISPDAFDLDRPVRVIVNGTEKFNALIDPDIDVLLRRAAIDDDRTMLFAARLTLTP